MSIPRQRSQFFKQWCRCYCRYVLTILNEAQKIAIGGVLVYRQIADALDGTEEDGNAAGTDSALISDLVYVGAMDNLTLAYAQGYESGLKPGNFTGVSLMQYLADEDSYYWTIDADGVYPRAVEIRYFVDLASQPVVVTLEPDYPWPVPDLEPPGTTFSGSECRVLSCRYVLPTLVDREELNQSCLDFSPQRSHQNTWSETRRGWAWTGTRSTSTTRQTCSECQPRCLSCFYCANELSLRLFLSRPCSMLTLTNVEGFTALGFIFNSNIAPPAVPVVKSSSSEGAVSGSAAAAWIVYIFMTLNIFAVFATIRAVKFARKRKEEETDDELLQPMIAKGQGL